jgi:predicted ATP-binding protein involved in virulence
MHIIERDTTRLKQATSNQGRELQFVTKAIESFIPEYSNLRVTRVPRPHMLVDKKGAEFKLNQLSDGEKNMIAMIGDIARRLSMANPTMKNPLKGDGIVLIDEVDLHLHPAWQRIIISKLTEVFPNCQFIITTHSPQILSHVSAEHIFLLLQKNNNMEIIKPTESYGKNTDRILEDILGVESRPLKIKKELHQLFQLIQKKDLDKARELMNKLENEIEGREPELVKANVLIERKEILGI